MSKLRMSPGIGCCALILVILIFYMYSNRKNKSEPYAFKEHRISVPYVKIHDDALVESQKEETVARSQNLTSITIDEIMAGPLSQDDPRILKYIEKIRIIYPPSEEAYNLVSPGIDPSKGQSTIVKKILNNMKTGFFVECGGLDGETRSNTLNLEKEFGWKGMLIEADPSNFKLLLKKHRKAWAANACLATKPYPHQVLFAQKFNQGKIFVDADAQTNSSAPSSQTPSKNPLVKVQCFPLFSLLTALKVTIVDYFSLDVEGNELQVLENIPFDKILIKVLSVEYIHHDSRTNTDRNDSTILTQFMKLQGYRVITRVNNVNHLANDLIFAHHSVPVTEKIEPIQT